MPLANFRKWPSGRHRCGRECTARPTIPNRFNCYRFIINGFSSVSDYVYCGLLYALTPRFDVADPLPEFLRSRPFARDSHEGFGRFHFRSRPEVDATFHPRALDRPNAFRYHDAPTEFLNLLNQFAGNSPFGNEAESNSGESLHRLRGINR